MRIEVLLALINKTVGERLKDLPERISARGPRGQRGPKGIDGKDFDFAEHEQKIKDWVLENSLKFEDLTEDQISELRGPRGRDGVDGKDGESFNFSDHENTISNIINNFIEDKYDSLKLHFSDLTEDDIASLRGPRGRDGLDGRNFVFEDHIDFFLSLKPKFSDFTEEERNSLKLYFKNLTEEEKSQLKLRFEDLTDEDKTEIRGPRGPRGQKGSTGEQGPQGVAGVRGLPGPTGITGRAGIDGRDGEDGRDGIDAPYVTDIEVDQRDAEAEFVFDFSDGSQIRTNPVRLPRPNVYSVAGGVAIGLSGCGSNSQTIGDINTHQVMVQVALGEAALFLYDMERQTLYNQDGYILMGVI